MAHHQDISSLSNHTEVLATHVDIVWHVDFAAQRIGGAVVTQLVTLGQRVRGVAFDAKGLEVTDVLVMPHGAKSAVRATWAKSPDANEALGDGLVVTLPETIEEAGVKFTVEIQYSTVPDKCLALCWLSKEQTDSKALPFVYSQCQAIHARTLLPCQDTPAVRITYNATVTTSEPTATVLMSALSFGAGDMGTKFAQSVPIASYLIAIAAGNIGAKDVSERCRVYAEPTMLEAAAWEFAEVEQLLTTAEDIAGKYEWRRYDLLVLPPSFPFGGMENPNLTFVTPTCICGDRSLVELVAHEICHSWSGNLVGIASWSDFWINEGFTSLLQRKITERLHGRDVADFESGTGVKHLQDDVKRYGAHHPYTALVPTLPRDVDPDDLFSSVPYEKGFAFLRKLEDLVGQADFEAWIKKDFFPTFGSSRSIHSKCATRSPRSSPMRRSTFSGNRSTSTPACQPRHWCCPRRSATSATRWPIESWPPIRAATCNSCRRWPNTSSAGRGASTLPSLSASTRGWTRRDMTRRSAPTRSARSTTPWATAIPTRITRSLTRGTPFACAAAARTRGTCRR
jgi:leukotriene-A4 hydrolase